MSIIVQMRPRSEFVCVPVCVTYVRVPVCVTYVRVPMPLALYICTCEGEPSSLMQWLNLERGTRAESLCPLSSTLFV